MLPGGGQADCGVAPPLSGAETAARADGTVVAGSG